VEFLDFLDAPNMFQKVQKSFPLPEPFVVKTLDKRRVERARTSAATADFWTV
jgi:hypothetical protein